ncbi:hypothetical protein [Sphingomonas sp.]|jgi:hypothetical protein|uniref:SEL1-like repeat protein n=1 Tax=Sphingomonas sp. TaxID=28214 RepID=UPI002D7E29E2|nr:hypothetical protein [Sphingomonas sp.]HEU0045460.1 hypothetical protein [Sphingomonas sp.]
MGNSIKSAQFLIESRLADAASGQADALYELGVCYSTGTSGVPIDLVEAHKWFNLAAIAGLETAKDCRTDIAEDMSAREIASAQAAARSWLASTRRIAA